MEHPKIPLELKEYAIAYELSQEFDYVPSESDYDKAKAYYGEFDIQVLVKHQGCRPDEIANQLVHLILKGY